MGAAASKPTSFQAPFPLCPSPITSHPPHLPLNPFAILPFAAGIRGLPSHGPATHGGGQAMLVGPVAFVAAITLFTLLEHLF